MEEADSGELSVNVRGKLGIVAFPSRGGYCGGQSNVLEEMRGWILLSLLGER